MKYGKPHVMRGEGDGITFYLGDRQGAPFVSVEARGFSGWSSSSRMPGGWEFFNPRVSVGRLFSNGRGRRWTREVLIPAKLVYFYRWKVKPSGRRYVREHPEPVEQVHA